MQNVSGQSLLDLILSAELLTQVEIDEALAKAKRSNTSLEEAIVDSGLMSDSNLGQLIATNANWNFIDLENTAVDKTLLLKIPEKFAKAQMAIPFEKSTSGIKVAMLEPNNQNTCVQLKKRFGDEIIPYYATERAVKSKFKLYKSNVQEELTKIVERESEAAAKGKATENSTIQIVNMILTRGHDQGASDIHIEPNSEQTVIRFRIDGVMHDILTLSKELHDLIIARIKVMAHLRTDEHQAPQDGKLRFQIGGEDIDVRVSVVPTTKGENAVMRMLAEESNRYSLTELGLSNRDFEKLENAINKPWGMILVTGPTGSGKTTTLYAVLKILNKKDVNIATIEDPVEYDVDGITQIQVHPKANLTFASGLKSIVRQDPDIILVGEIRDEETSTIAVNSAMTGHLVLSTLHTNDAATTFPRILDMGIEPFLVSSTINIIIAQRLLRKICRKCIHSYETDLADLADKIPISVLERLARGNNNVTLYRGEGCDVCNQTGYAGRTGIFELLEVDNNIRRLIMENADADTIREAAVNAGMTLMFDDAREKVLNGETTIEEMLRVVKG